MANDPDLDPPNDPFVRERTHSHADEGRDLASLARGAIFSPADAPTLATMKCRACGADFPEPYAPGTPSYICDACLAGGAL